ncbi:M15 family metallopeptidase [Actinophytocola oryzae]|uniref:D-alanyl-D-alanine dipeptidase n=1 Tax=Actinophytocola oryzae TaxID=502181 RepID=A0A4R7VHL2_9PSEU|nr:M15 family metallopeptidase [Actinophytocola oryzae]TDV48836.1 D-alanyl-D-alanine dipeptidase [Actinophytocola oryzae]
MPPFVLLSDPRVVDLPVQECGEPLVDLRDTGVIRIDTRLADELGAYAHVRLSVADRLVAAQSQLPRGLRLLVVEGFRPQDVQKRYFVSSMSRVALANPDWSAERVRTESATYVSPPEVAPHVAGGAVDLTLCTVDGDELPMGTEVNETPPEYDTACFTASPLIDAEARANRTTLIEAMTASGFVNYPSEWWHWSYGDRYWAFNTGPQHARYGPATLDLAHL